MKQYKKCILDVHGATVDLAQYFSADDTKLARLSIIIPQQITCAIDCSAIAVSDFDLDVEVQSGAQVRFIWDQSMYASLHQNRTVRLKIDRDARCTIGFFGVISGAVHSAISIELTGVRAEVQTIVLGASYSTGMHALDITVAHQESETISSVRARDLVFDAARSTFNARTIMQNGVHNADGMQEHKALLFSEYAHAESFPEIEVLTDQISCAHASAIGQLSDEQLAYLVAKSLTPEHAKKLLIQAFIMQVQQSTNTDALFAASIDRFLRYCKELV